MNHEHSKTFEDTFESEYLFLTKMGGVVAFTHSSNTPLFRFSLICQSVLWIPSLL